MPVRSPRTLAGFGGAQALGRGVRPAAEPDRGARLGTHAPVGRAEHDQQRLEAGDRALGRGACTAELRWADGSTLSVPVLAATTAYTGLSKPKSFVDEKCPADKSCRPLRVIAVARGKATMPSSRGDVRVPTWDFTVKGVPEPFRRVAVDPAAMGGPPRPLDDGIQEVHTYEVRAPTELPAGYLHRRLPTRRAGSRVHETPEAVVVDVDVRQDDVEICNAMGKIDPDRRHAARAPGPPGGAGLQQRSAPCCRRATSTWSSSRTTTRAAPDRGSSPERVLRVRTVGPERYVNLCGPMDLAGPLSSVPSVFVLGVLIWEKARKNVGGGR